MVDYEKLYRILFNGITDAIRDIDHDHFGLAKARLVSTQQKAEELYINEEESFSSTILT